MKQHLALIVCCALLYVGASDPGPSADEEAGNPSVNRLLESLVARLESLEFRMQKMERMQLRLQRVEGSSCKDVSSNVSDTYLIRVKNDSEPFLVYCEQKAFGGGWIVFQYRYDGSLDFYRGWDEFRDGFGDLNKEFWLGLEKVHQITSGRKHELMIELKDFNGTYKYAQFNAFEIGSESDQYDVKAIGKYSGTAGDRMSHYKGRKFSTKDRDNDESSRHCAQYIEGAWWHWFCADSVLNARYMNAEAEKAMHWYHFYDNYQGLSYSRMMIRELA